VGFVVENFGQSKLAERFGIRRYPAIFVDDVLIAKPYDFGFFGEGEKAGRYNPWLAAESHEKFKKDLKRMIDLILAGKKEDVVRERESNESPQEVLSLPSFEIKDLAGDALTPDQLRGRIVLVEFWATWCPPCHSTLERLGGLEQSYVDKLAILAIAVESPEDKVRELAGNLSRGIHWVIATPELGRAFGDVTAVPTMFLFDRDGKIAGLWFGAPSDLEEQVANKLVELTGNH